MSVTSKHPQYNNNVGRWTLVRDVINSDVKQYIKSVDSSDVERSERYRDDATFTNFTGRTKAGLVGAVFGKDIEIDLPGSIKYLEKDSTGNGLSLEKLAQEITGEVLQAGRYGLLVDFPASEDGLTAAEVTNLNLKARINKYKAESIINWQQSTVNGISQVILVVLLEHVDTVGEDGFTWVTEKQYRVLRLINNVYVQQMYNQDGDLIHEYIPRDFNGVSFEIIPFVFVGSEDNDSDVDIAPLYDLSQLNIGHLRNSADYEESVHVTGQPTLIMSTNMSAQEFKNANPGGVIIGARRGFNLGPGGSATMLQASPNQLADVAMKRKEEQAVMLGARLVMPAGQNETAEAARIKHSGENSVLSTITKNVNDALLTCIDYAMRFMSNKQVTQDVIFVMNTQFFDVTVDPQMIMAKLQLFNSGIIAAQDIRTSLRKTGELAADRTDDDINSDVEQMDPIGDINVVNPNQV